MVYRPKYRDPKTGEVRESRVWWFEFRFSGKRIRKSSKTTNKRLAEQIEATRKADLARGHAGIIDHKPAPTLREFAREFTAKVETDCKPSTAIFYKAKLEQLLKCDFLASASL